MFIVPQLLKIRNFSRAGSFNSEGKCSETSERMKIRREFNEEAGRAAGDP